LVNPPVGDKSAAMTLEDRFIEAMGMVAQSANLPRTAGRIAGLLMLADAPMSFSAIAKRLGVSRGNISTNTRLLLRQGVVERAAVADERETYFQSSTQSPYRAILEQQVAVNAAALEAIEQTVAELPTMSATVKDRLARHRLFLQTANQLIQHQLALVAGSEPEVHRLK
jgi:DNA-binding transcriptional regulator GbsR (MarR family)